ncbi:DDHD domain-containing protein [Gongronella butleri]|nr:DDHD domain-containing protein [Gongronella butleri]
MYDSYPADLPNLSRVSLDDEPPMQGEEEIHSVWEEQDDCDIDHVIFVIHGIGQQTERFGYFAQHMETLRNTICEILQAKTPDRDLRIQLIPIEWHKHIHERTDGVLNTVTLDNIPGMRLVSNDYIMDALYYLSHDRQQSILDHVVHTFNEGYHEFIDEHPDFQGNIGIFGYSLGGLISWDILSHQRALHTKEERAQVEKLNLNVPRLVFQPQFLFGVGCPLGALLNIRNQDPKLYHPDSSIIFENIYHPCDPLAYRVEPLYHPDCRHHRSVQVETAMPNNGRRSSLQCLTGWLSSWFQSDECDLKEEDEEHDPLASTEANSNENDNDDALSTCFDDDGDIGSVLRDEEAFDAQDQGSLDHPHDDAPSSWQNPVSPPPNMLAPCPEESLFEASSSSSSPLDASPLAPSPCCYAPTESLGPLEALTAQDEQEEQEEEVHDVYAYDRRCSQGSSSTTNSTGTAGTNTNLFSSVGALFQYISPRASFDRDSAFGSDIEDHDDDALEIKRQPRPRSMEPATMLPPSPPPQLSVPAHDPAVLYRRRQSQIYDLPSSSSSNSFWMHKRRRQSMPNLREQAMKLSTLEEDPVLLQALPNGRRVDYVLQPDPVFGGMISNSYVLGLQAHFSYWTNKDMLWHIVQQLDNGELA